MLVLMRLSEIKQNHSVCLALLHAAISLSASLPCCNATRGPLARCWDMLCELPSDLDQKLNKPLYSVTLPI